MNDSIQEEKDETEDEDEDGEVEGFLRDVFFSILSFALFPSKDWPSRRDTKKANKWTNEAQNLVSRALK